MLRKAKIGIFAHIVDDFTEETIDYDLKVASEDPRDLGRMGYVEVRLKNSQHVDAIRLNCSLGEEHKKDRIPFSCRATWKGSDLNRSDEHGPRGELYFSTQPGGGTAAVWINDTIESLKIYPDFRLVRIKSLTLIKRSNASAPPRPIRAQE